MRIEDGRPRGRAHQSGSNAVQAPKPAPATALGRWNVISRVGSMIVGVFAAFLFAYWITITFYGWIGTRPGPYLVQATSIGLAMVLMLVIGLVVGRIAAPQQRVFWQSLMSAIRQMAKGDFNVRVGEPRVNGPWEFRQLVHSINDMAQELGHLEQMRQEFISNVSHEIQSPLTAILGFVEVLKNGDLSLEHKEHCLNIIATESKRMSRLSENLLKLSSLESGSYPFHPESFRLDRQIRDVVLSLEPVWMKKDIQIELSLQNMSILADQDLLSQVWSNLLTNAMKFTAPGGSMFVSLHRQVPWVVVSIRDTGTGIKKDDQPRIFERFVKGDKSRQRSESGNGLGLTIVKQIVDLHEGEIHVESEIGVGTLFSIRLPDSAS